MLIDELRELLLVCAVILAVGAVFLTLPALIGVIRLFRQSRVSLGEYLALFLGLNVAIGLTTLLLSNLPAKEPPAAGTVWGAALVAGLLAAWGGCVGLYIAHQLEVESPRRRYLLLLRGLLLFPAYLAFALGLSGLLALPLYRMDRSGALSAPGESGIVTDLLLVLLLALGLLLLAAAGGWHIRRMSPLFEAARRVERERREAADAAGFAALRAESRLPPDEPDAADQSDRSDGSDAAAPPNDGGAP